MKRLSIVLSSLVGGTFFFASLLYALGVVGDRFPRESIDSHPDCVQSGCAAEQRPAARLVCRAA